ncbi:hypothetical protein [Pontibacter anaerobius]|uniref:Uncharacterized protein n=1 Tax=Pontibacter anaerobius TaxID=2993940 RepID=A0ABT3RHN0_9BACT|nr:hypothetical protein [Pontibacter anaerobius]MCX2741290.1 hypothetical protein [Pontibacter anaerobius]
MRIRKSAAERFRTRMSGTVGKASIKYNQSIKYGSPSQSSYKRNTTKGHKSEDLRQKSMEARVLKS